MPRSVVHLITSLGGGGTETYLHQLLSRTPGSWTNEVLYLHQDGVMGERIRRLGFRTQRMASPWQAAGFLREKKPDVLHTCLFWGHQVGRVIGRAARTRVVSSQQAIDVWQQPWHRTLDWLTLPLCDAVIVNSNAAEQVIRARLGRRRARRPPPIFKVENGLDFERFAPGSRESARHAFGIPPGAVAGGTLMRLHPEKGAEKIPAFADAALKANPRLILFVGGVGPLEAALKKATGHWGDRLRWIGWQEDTVSYLSALDFFWLLSREESFPQALLEASGMALPWLAPDVGSVRDLKKAGAAGLLYPAKDLDAAVRGCGEVIANLAALGKTAHAARAALEPRYSLGHMVQTFYTSLDRLVEPAEIKL